VVDLRGTHHEDQNQNRAVVATRRLTTEVALVTGRTAARGVLIPSSGGAARCSSIVSLMARVGKPQRINDRNQTLVAFGEAAG